MKQIKKDDEPLPLSNGAMTVYSGRKYYLFQIGGLKNKVIVNVYTGKYDTYHEFRYL